MKKTKMTAFLSAFAISAVTVFSPLNNIYAENDSPLVYNNFNTNDVNGTVTVKIPEETTAEVKITFTSPEVTDEPYYIKNMTGGDSYSFDIEGRDTTENDYRNYTLSVAITGGQYKDTAVYKDTFTVPDGNDNPDSFMKCDYNFSIDDKSTGNSWDITSESKTEKNIVMHLNSYTMGDLNNDGLIDAVDATAVLIEYAEVSTSGETTLSERQKLAGDINKDGLIDAVDASIIQVYYAEVSTHGNPSWDNIINDTPTTTSVTAITTTTTNTNKTTTTDTIKTTTNTTTDITKTTTDTTTDTTKATTNTITDTTKATTDTTTDTTKATTNTTTNTTKATTDTTKTTTTTTTAPASIDYSSYMNSVKLLDGSRDDTMTFHNYYIYDINNDGIYELITEMGTCEADNQYSVYSMKNGEMIFAGDITAGHTRLVEKDGKLYTNYGMMGTQSVDMITFDGEKISKENVYSESSVTDYIEYGTAINSYDWSDMSGINKIKNTDVTTTTTTKPTATTTESTTTTTQETTATVTTNEYFQLYPNNVFCADLDLIDLSPSQVQDKTGINVPEPQAFPYWGVDLKYSDIKVDGFSVCLLFQYDKLAMICYDTIGTELTSEVITSIENFRGTGQVDSDNDKYWVYKNCLFMVYSDYYINEEQNGYKQIYVSNNYNTSKVSLEDLDAAMKKAVTSQDYLLDPQYCYEDVDGDGIPELFLKAQNMAGMMIQVYIYKDGEFVSTSKWGEQAYVSDDYKLFRMKAYEGANIDLIYSITDSGTPELIDSISMYAMEYYHNDEKISKSEYDSRLAEYDALSWTELLYNQVPLYENYPNIQNAPSDMQYYSKPQNGIVATDSGTLNMRTGAGTNYSIITSLMKGTKIQILGWCNDWCYVKYSSGNSDTYGFMSREFVKYSYESDNNETNSGTDYSSYYDYINDINNKVANNNFDGLTPTSYKLYDIDKDGIQEIIMYFVDNNDLSVNCKTCWHILSTKNSSPFVINAGNTDSSFRVYNNKLYYTWLYHGYQSAEPVTFTNGTFKKDSTEMSWDNLSEFHEFGSKLTTYDWNDLSGLNALS